MSIIAAPSNWSCSRSWNRKYDYLTWIMDTHT